MDSKKIAKPQQKPLIKPSNTSNPQSKSLDDRKAQHTLSPSKTFKNTRHDPEALIKNASKKKEEIEKKLKADYENKKVPKKISRDRFEINSNSSKHQSSLQSQTSFQKHKRIQNNKARLQSKSKDNVAQSKKTLNVGNSSFVTMPTHQIIQSKTKNTRSEVNLVKKYQKPSKQNEAILQNNKSITGYLSKKQPTNRLNTTGSGISKVTSKQKEDSIMSKNRSNIQKSTSLQNKQQHPKTNQTEHPASKNSKQVKVKEKVTTKQQKNCSSRSDLSQTLSNDKITNNLSHQVQNVQQSQQIKYKSSKDFCLKNNDVVPYSDQQFRKIQVLVSRMHEYQSQEPLQVYHYPVLCLMSWIWEAHMPNYSRKQHKIDSSKCLRKLLEIYDKTKSSYQIFSGLVSLGKVNFQTDFYFEQEKPIISKQKPILSKQILEIEESSPQKSTPSKKFIIYDIIRNFKTNHLQEIKTSFIFLLFEIIIYNYDEISNLDQMIPTSIFQNFKNYNTKSNKYELFEEINHKILQELIIFTFTQLTYLKTNVDRSPQFMKKKRLQVILWKYFMDFIKILNHQIKTKQFINFRLCEALTLQTSYYFATEFTHFAKRYPLKNLDSFVNMIEFEAFMGTFVERVIQFNVYVLQLKDRQKHSIDIEIDGPNQLFQFNFDLPIYDWAMLAIKSDERKTFQNIVKHCKRLFIKNLEKKSTSKYETYQNKPYVKDRYARFTIQEMPDEEKSFYEDPHTRQRPQQQDASGYKISYDKLKGFVSIPHMNFLVFKEFVPMSVKRLTAQKRPKFAGEKFDSHLLFLLILSNSQYLLKLIMEIEFSSLEMLNPEIGKGLIRLCGYCHDFKSVVIGEKYLRILRSNSLHKELTQKIFEKDNDYQRRLSSTMMNKNVTSKINDPFDENKEKNEPQKIESPEVIQIRVKSCETMYFEMIMEIENVVPFIPLEHYLQQVMKRPTIFRHDKFYVKLLQIQHPSAARQYFQELIVCYIDDELRTVDLMTYFEIFADYCLKKEVFEEMWILVQSLPIGKLIKFHSLLFSQTFNDQISYRVVIPDGISKEQRFSILTSAGYEEKTKFIDQHCPSIKQVLLWRKFLKPVVPFQKVEKYICIKQFFTIVHQIFSDPKNSSKNHEYVNLIIVEKLKTWIQKDKIQEVTSAFHFLSLAFFPHQQSKINSNLSKDFMKDRRLFFGSKIIENSTGIEEKLTLQILYLIGEHSNALIEMYKNKQSLTLRCLGEEMRKRPNDDLDEKVDDMKRREVLKMLNKMKNTHDYLIRSIIRFVQNVNYTNGILRNFHGPEEYLEKIQKICRCEHMQKDQKRSQALEEYYTQKVNLKLSSVCSNNLFQANIQKYLKRFNENPKYIHERYNFLTMIRCIAEMWIDQKLPSLKNGTSMQNESKSKSQFIVDKKDSKTRDTGGHSSFSSMIPIEKILEICIDSLNHPIDSQNSLRECEILKQKLIALDTLSLLFNSFTNKFDLLKFMASSVAKIFKAKYYPQISQIIVNLLMNNPRLLGKQEKDLMIAIRLKALSMLIQNFKGDEKYAAQQFKILDSSQHFWFLINTLVFDRNIEIRLFIIKTLYSRYDKFSNFKTSMIEKVVISVFIASQDNNKSFAQIAKKSIELALSKYLATNSTNPVNILNTIAMNFFLFLVNLNTVHFLQKGQLKIEYKEFFMIWIDIIFDRKDADAYLYAILEYFDEIVNSTSELKITQIFSQIKWHYDFHVDFYMMTRPSKIRTVPDLNSQNQQNNKAYLELLEDMKKQLFTKQNQGSKKLSSAGNKQQIYHKMYPKYNQIFKANIESALMIFKDVFLQRAAKGNKKSLKTKKPQSLFRNFGNVFNEDLKDKKDSFKNRKTKVQEKRPGNESEIEI